MNVIKQPSKKQKSRQFDVTVKCKTCKAKMHLTSLLDVCYSDHSITSDWGFICPCCEFERGKDIYNINELPFFAKVKFDKCRDGLTYTQQQILFEYCCIMGKCEELTPEEVYFIICVCHEFNAEIYPVSVTTSAYYDFIMHLINDGSLPLAVNHFDDAKHKYASEFNRIAESNRVTELYKLHGDDVN